MRKQATIKLKDEMLLAQNDTDKGQAPQTFGDDAGKIFRFTEMPALKLEQWYVKMYSLVYDAAGEEEKKQMAGTKESQSAALAVASAPNQDKFMERVTGQIQYLELLNEFFSCFEYYEPGTDRYIPVNRDNIDEYIGMTAIRYLRDYAAKESLKNFR